MKTHVVWTLGLEDESPRAAAVWSTDGVLRTEREAVKLASQHRGWGTKALALKLGTEPRHLHPADRPIIVTGY